MKSNFLKERASVFISISVFRLCLDFMYLNFIVFYFGYAGFELSDNTYPYIISWVIVLIYSLFINANIVKPSDYFLMIAATSVAIPLTTIYGLSERSIEPVIATISSFIAMYFIVRFKAPYNIKLFKISKGKQVANYLSWFFVLILIAWYFISGAVRYFNLDFSKVYDYRTLSAELVNVGIMSYITGWVYNVFSLYAISYALWKKNYAVVVLLFIIQTFFFGVSAHKSVLFTPFLVFGVWFYLQRFKTLLVIPISLSVILFFVYFLALYTDDILLPSLFIRRVFFVPAQLAFDWFSFFGENEYIYWSTSILSPFIDYPYHVGPPLLIGEYLGSDTTAANNGFVSTGYSHFGYIGIAIYVLIFSFILRFMNKVAQTTPIWFILALTITPLRTAIVSSDLPTTLLTHGLLISLLLLLLSLENSKRSSEL